MTNPPLDLSLKDIAEHTPWMRRLANGLLGDPAAADDVVQEVWTRFAGAGRRPGYVAAVVRSLAHRRRREEQRRSQRERDIARGEALPSAAQVAERAELAHRLAQAVEELEEPYRTTIVLRYYEDLSSAEIARRSGSPAATVRTRLMRGLELLRARLDDRPGGRARWMGALLPLVRAETKGGPLLALAPPLVLLSAKLVAVVLLALGGLAVLWARLSGDADPRTPPLVTAAQESDRTDASEARAERTPLETPLVEAGRSASEASSQPSGKVLASLPSGRIRARVVSETGADLLASWLRLRLAPEDSAQADAGGNLELEVEPDLLEWLALSGSGRRVDVEVGARGHRTTLLRPFLPEGAHALDLGEVALEPGGAVRGRVLDADGLGVEGALVVVGLPSAAEPEDIGARLRGPLDLERDMTEARPLALLGSSGAGGDFHLDGVAVGFATVWARTTTSLWSFSAPVGVRAGEDVYEVELVVKDERERIIGGRVLDPEGRPLRGVELTFTTSDAEEEWWNVSTNTLGAFYFATRDGTAQDITARSPSWEWEDQKRADVAPGTLDLDIVFERSRWLAVEVQDQDGMPICNGRVVGLPASGPTDRPLQRCESPLDSVGRARLRRPDGPLRVRVEAYGYRDRLVGPLVPEDFPDPLLVTLEPVPALIGQVRQADGRPAARATVSLHSGAAGGGGVTPPGGAGAAPDFLSHQGWSGDRDPFVYRVKVAALAEVTADEEGFFRLPLPGVETATEDEVESPPGPLAGLGYVGGRESVAKAKAGRTWYVHAALVGEATITSGPHEFEPTRDAELDLALPRGGSIAGRLVFADGTSPAGWTARASDALAEIAEAPVAADGTFRFQHLHAGGWQVRAFAPGRRYYPGQMRTSRTPEADVEVVAGRTVVYVHTTGPRASARLHGRLWVDGAPAGPWRIIVRTSTPHASITSHETTLDPDGCFELTLEPGQRTSLVASRGADTLALIAHPTILAGHNEWSFDLDTARIEGTLVVAESTGWASNRPTYEQEVGGVTIRTSLNVEEDGRFGPILVPAGRGILRGPRVDFRNPGPIWAELDLEAGETRRVERH